MRVIGIIRNEIQITSRVVSKDYSSLDGCWPRKFHGDPSQPFELSYLSYSHTQTRKRDRQRDRDADKPSESHIPVRALGSEIGPICFLARCRKTQLNQALSVLYLILVFIWVYSVFSLRPLWMCSVSFVLFVFIPKTTYKRVVSFCLSLLLKHA